jgi:hypothetical protein
MSFMMADLKEKNASDHVLVLAAGLPKATSHWDRAIWQESPP